MPDLHLLFNHILTDTQHRAARRELGVGRIIPPPEDVRGLWRAIPPEPDSIRSFLTPIFTWIDTTIQPRDFLLVQGDVGACWLVVDHVQGKDIIPVYATTTREAKEERLGKEKIRLTHTFAHVRFRRYGR